jgi:hypothetical protein
VLGAPEVAARAVEALEVVTIMVPRPVAVPAKAMRAEAALAPEEPGALETQAVRPATTAAEDPGEPRLQHPRPQHQIRPAQQAREQRQPLQVHNRRQVLQVHEQRELFRFQQL